MQTYDYPISLGSDNHTVWLSLRPRFLKRVKTVQINLATRTPHRANCVCQHCDKQWPMESLYVLGQFCWTSTFRHRVRKHDEYVNPIFWLFMVALTPEIKFTKSERLVVNAFMQTDIPELVREHVDYYILKKTRTRPSGAF